MADDTYIDQNGRELWAEGNSLGKKPHSLARRPRGLAFNAETGQLAARLRWDQRRESAERGMVRATAKVLNKDIEEVSPADAWEEINFRQTELAIGESAHTAAAKFVGVATDSLPHARDESQRPLSQTINIIPMPFDNLLDVLKYLEQQREVGNLENATFIEGQLKELPQEGPMQIQTLWKTRQL